MAARLIELHRHIEGSIRLATIHDLGQKHHIAGVPEGIDELRRTIEITKCVGSLPEFLKRLEICRLAYVDLDACRRVAKECVIDAAHEDIGYAELRFSPSFMAAPHRLPMDGVIEAVCCGVQEGIVATGIQVNLIGILDRSYGIRHANEELDVILRHQNSFVGVDLAGDEARYPPERFISHFKRVRKESSLRITVHAGEALGPASIWAAIDKLGAHRIGHAVRAIEDSDLVEELRKRPIGIEACLTSNLHTGAVESYQRHPIGRYLAAGVQVAIGTDDPTVSGVTLAHERTVAAKLAGLTLDQVRKTQEHALSMAFVSEPTRAKLAIILGC
ncbi:MAG: adenosine deaminase [Pirellulaceae bacterium]